MRLLQIPLSPDEKLGRKEGRYRLADEGIGARTALGLLSEEEAVAVDPLDEVQREAADEQGDAGGTERTGQAVGDVERALVYPVVYPSTGQADGGEDEDEGADVADERHAAL